MSASAVGFADALWLCPERALRRFFVSVSLVDPVTLSPLLHRVFADGFRHWYVFRFCGGASPHAFGSVGALGELRWLHLYRLTPDLRSRPPRMAPSPRHSGVRRISGLIPDSTVQVRVGTHGSSSGPTHDPSPHDRLSSFSLHYTNIRGLNSNFSSVESHLATSSPNLFLLSETQLSSQSSPDPFPPRS